MPSFEPFSFKECLPSRSQAALHNILQIKLKQNPEVLILRLLSGTLNLKNNTSGLIVKQRRNYVEFDFVENSRISSALIFKIFSSDNIGKPKVINYYTNCVRFGNKNLFKNLLLELCNYFHQTQKGSHATAFLHLYRSFELISYCFPLFYASKATSYEKTFVSLKEYFSKVDGERAFFKKFVHEHLFKGDIRLDQSLKIRINAPNMHLQKQYYDAIKRLCDKNEAIDVKSATPNSEIIISRKGLTSLIIDLRNRYFHLLTGDFNDNFSSGELAEIDSYFHIMNDIILNWLSVIYLQIIKKTIIS